MTLSVTDIEDLMDQAEDEEETEETEMPEQGENSADDPEQANVKKHITIRLQEVAISDLPPLPTPMPTYTQRYRGTKSVLISIFVFVGSTHGLALETFGGFERYSTPWWVFFIIIYTQAALAIIGLIAMIVVDPGVVQRSKESCYPIPYQMGPALQEFLEQKGKADEKNIVLPRVQYLMADDGSGDSYCVRCMVWRRKRDGRHYHCSTCQRCVKKYDHHCNIFGRCIAGGLFSMKGNYKFFVMMITLFFTAFFTSFIAVMWSLSNVYGPAWVIPIGCLVVLLMVFSRSLMVCGACRRA